METDQFETIPGLFEKKELFKSLFIEYLLMDVS